MTLKPFFQQRIDEAQRREQAKNMTRQDMFDHGFLTAADLDDEELRHGKCRDANGKIPKNSRKTEMVPRDLYDEMVAEHQSRTNEKLRQQLDTMIQVMIDVATDDTVEPRDRMEAAKYLFERVAGKTPEKINVTVQKAPWEEVFAGIAHVTREQHHALQNGVIEAEVVEPEPEPEQPATEYVPDPAQSAPIGGFGLPQAPNAQPKSDPSLPSTVPPLEGESLHKIHSHMDPQVDPNIGPAPLAQGQPDNPVYSSTSAQVSDVLRAQQEAAEMLAARRKAAKARIQNAKKQRIIARAIGADAKSKVDIEVEVTEERIKFTLG